MNIICPRQSLLDAVANVQRAVSGKSTLPALEGILLRASADTLFLAGFDLELGITTSIEANVQQPGEIVLTARLFGDIIRKMPGETLYHYPQRPNRVHHHGYLRFGISGDPLG